MTFLPLWLRDKVGTWLIKAGMFVINYRRAGTQGHWYSQRRFSRYHRRVGGRCEGSTE
jgi:hypothetical protein